MTEPTALNGMPRRMLELLVAYLALHGAFNIGLRTEVTWTLRAFAVIGAAALLVGVVRHRLTRTPG